MHVKPLLLFTSLVCAPDLSGFASDLVCCVWGEAEAAKWATPDYWQHHDQGCHLEPTDGSERSRMQDWIEKTVHPGHNSGCGTGELRLPITVTKMLLVENGRLWHQYQFKKDCLRSNHEDWKKKGLRVPSIQATAQPAMKSVKLSAELNELFLFHGTSSAAAHIIAEHGFDERVSNLTGLYGAGIYFADCSCKSHQYAHKSARTQGGEHVLLFCRVTMGWAFPTKEKHANQRRPPDNPDLQNRPYDSTFAKSRVADGGRPEHNEFVVFDRNQVSQPECLSK
eukprot:349544-Rhodomonas_salina.4